jgi:hypothetical protein
MMTWRPWKPVVTKKVLPKEPLLKSKLAPKYSLNWTKVKSPPKRIVKIIPSLILSPERRLWWAQVTVTPLLRRMAVFRRGTQKGSKGWTLTGGQTNPTSGVGTLEWWKKAQNQAAKNITSLKMNNPIPNFNPSWTTLLWSPISPSRESSRHQQ